MISIKQYTNNYQASHVMSKWKHFSNFSPLQINSGNKSCRKRIKIPVASEIVANFQSLTCSCSSVIDTNAKIVFNHSFGSSEDKLVAYNRTVEGMNANPIAPFFPSASRSACHEDWSMKTEGGVFKETSPKTEELSTSCLYSLLTSSVCPICIELLWIVSESCSPRRSASLFLLVRAVSVLQWVQFFVTRTLWSRTVMSTLIVNRQVTWISGDCAALNKGTEGGIGLSESDGYSLYFDLSLLKRWMFNEQRSQRNQNEVTAMFAIAANV